MGALLVRVAQSLATGSKALPAASAPFLGPSILAITRYTRWWWLLLLVRQPGNTTGQRWHLRTTIPTCSGLRVAQWRLWSF